MQGMADGNKAVIGHYSQEDIVHKPKKEEKRYLCQAFCIVDDSDVSYDVHNQLWDCRGGETDVSEGQVGEEEVHGGMKVGVRNDRQDDEQVPKHCDQVHGQEQSKEDGLQVWIL
ncbi:hypothetical protein H920_00948 [Fukomys damarensis]|uniref:Uncharacterized protein n=1 Tax=Fukomys damarensis TaxID=885580 RepID=A0A091EPM9_FUKDA|nr:hypothetical protein H920_00948 [Fukomys damarensis]